MANFDDDDIRWLISLLADEGLEEVEFTQGSQSVVVSAPPRVAHCAPVAGMMLPAAAGQPAVALPLDGVPALSPMPGVLPRASSPGAAPYVEIGDRVEAGDTLGLIEAMKMFNEVAAPVAGIVTTILVGNEAQVDADQPLMVIRLATE